MISAERLVLLAMEPMAKIGADEAATPKDIIIAPENSAPTSPPNRIKAATTWQNAPALLPLELTSFDFRSPWTWLGVEPEELEGKLFSGEEGAVFRGALEAMARCITSLEESETSATGCPSKSLRITRSGVSPSQLSRELHCDFLPLEL